LYERCAVFVLIQTGLIVMKNIFVVSLAAVLSMGASLAHSQDVPQAPHRIQEAETLGLSRVSADELRNLLQGSLQYFGETYSGQPARSVMVFSPDGTVEKTAGDKSLQGTWNIDESKNAYCTAFTFKKKGFEKNCFAVFRAADGIHYFDYDVNRGFDAHVWRRATEK
jgi:hypothetical protein